MNIRVVRSARRHKVGNQRIMEAMADAGARGDWRSVALRRHGRPGVEPKIVAVPDDCNPGGLAVIHAMPTNFRGKEGEPA